MIVAELRELLENYADDARVILCGDDGWGALRVQNTNGRLQQVCFIEDDDEDEEDDDE